MKAVVCSECDGDSFTDIETFVQVTGSVDVPSVEIIVATCKICGFKGEIERRVV
jgi:hypothetical protein|tara:strand:- start:3949 stop:4110 length:162 start_codon:yes stop_codon:yes gene_type:complete